MNLPAPVPGLTLSLTHLAYLLPVVAYEPPGHPDGEAIRILLPVADPKSLGLMPEMEGDLRFDDGTVLRIRIGSSWTVGQAGGEVRIPIVCVPSLRSPIPSARRAPR
jgi:hypothetical protein